MHRDKKRDPESKITSHQRLQLTNMQIHLKEESQINNTGEDISCSKPDTSATVFPNSTAKVPRGLHKSAGRRFGYISSPQ